MSDLQQFWERLGNGPAFVFLGQGYFGLDSGADPFLAEVRTKFGGPDISDRPYELLFEGSAQQSGTDAFAWLSERCRRLSAPGWFGSVSDYPWSGFYSSAIDSVWTTALRNDWREIAPIFEDTYFPRDPRNRRVLHCTFLFGSVNQTEASERPPLTSLEYLRRKPVATSLARRLPDEVTPLGTLVIEGYLGDSDWFSLEDFYPVLQSFGRDQIHVFSVTPRLAQNAIVGSLVQDGKIVLHEESLAWALDQGATQGFLRQGPPQDWEDAGRSITLGTRRVLLPKDRWNRVTNSATVLDDYLLAEPAPVSEEARYWEFRRFLFESASRPLWSGYAHGFAFRRHFEAELHKMVQRRLSRERSNVASILVHGQTGTGKTVALGSLAYQVAKGGRHPVLYIERRTQRPIYTDIDRFCQWLEDNGAACCLIVWDGMLRSAEYDDLLGFLSSRGRNVVLVGSSYRVEAHGQDHIAVPERLTEEESREFLEFLQEKGVSINARLRSAVERRDTTYLVALYRMLPSTRPGIRHGVVQEIEDTERALGEAIRTLQSNVNTASTLGEAFVEAGIIDRSALSKARGTEIGATDIQDLIDLVMMPGRFGLSVPVELLVRTWGQGDFSNFAYILREFDIVRSYEDSAGGLVVAPRHPLEAQLICQARIGTVHAEIEIVSRLLMSMRAGTGGPQNDAELNFVIELVGSVGPQGSEAPRFRPFYRELASALKKAREIRNIKSPRLMLREANLLREWVTFRTRTQGRPEDSQEVLVEAQTTVREALELLNGDRRDRSLRSTLATELASVLGTETMDAINRGASVTEISSSFQRLREAVHSARSANSLHYYPVDVLVWTTTAVVRAGALDETERVEAIADVLHAMETIDVESLDEPNAELFYRRRMDLGELLGDRELTDEAFNDLLELGSAAGFYVRAIQKGGIPLGGEVNEEDASKYEAAWSYLEEHRAKIRHDPRCLNLLLDYWWGSKTHGPLFHDERRLPPFDQHDWQYCARLLTELKSLQGAYRTLHLGFLEALAAFHLNQIPQALQLFREVETESYLVHGRRRIIRSFVASDDQGKPRIHHGTVREIDTRGRRGQVYVEELGQRITFIPQDFGVLDINPGDTLGEFHIAFNFLGPIADPVSRLRP